MKFHDLDADGVKDAGEMGLAGWTIYVDYDDDDVKDAGEPSAVTGADGTYTISGINLGTWKVKEVLQAGWTQSYPASGYHEETFTSGASLTENDFGNWTTATKSGMKYHDLNADGDQDAGELGLEGWVIFVDYDDDGAWDAGEPKATTAADGTYTITGIVPGTYDVVEELSAGWFNSDPGGGMYANEVFVSDADLTGNDFGNWQYAKKSGYKFLDMDRDGVRDGDEPGLSGWTIKLWKGSPGDLELVTSMLTDSNGYYEFPAIKPGITYYVTEELPNTMWVQTCPNSSTPDAVDLGVLGYGYMINLDSQEHHANNNFGNWYYHDETAWAYDPDRFIEFNTLIGPNNWGWSNGPYTKAELLAGIELELRAGVGQNDVENKGALVGHLEMMLSADEKTITVRYIMTSPNMLETAQVWIGNTELPKKKTGKTYVMTNAPGQFPYKWSGSLLTEYTFTIDLSKDKNIKDLNSLYLAAHADVRMFEEID